jgi:hypothetical protein
MLRCFVISRRAWRIIVELSVAKKLVNTRTTVDVCSSSDCFIIDQNRLKAMQRSSLTSGLFDTIDRTLLTAFVGRQRHGTCPFDVICSARTRHAAEKFIASLGSTHFLLAHFLIFQTTVIRLAHSYVIDESPVAAVLPSSSDKSVDKHFSFIDTSTLEKRYTNNAVRSPSGHIDAEKIRKSISMKI